MYAAKKPYYFPGIFPQ